MKYGIWRKRALTDSFPKRLKLPVRGESDTPSMPSGDTAGCGCFCFIYTVYLNIPAIFVILPFVMLGRVYYHAHYIGDTIIGAFVGLASGGFMISTIQFLIPFFVYVAGPDTFIPLP